MVSRAKTIAEHGIAWETGQGLWKWREFEQTKA